MMGIKDKKQQRELAAAVARGRELRRSGRDPEEALKFLEKAVERFPEDAELRLLYAASLSIFSPETATAEAALAADLGRDDPVILVRAGHLLLASGDHETARWCAVRADELAQPGFVLMSGLVHLNGLLAALAGEDAVAEENLRSAVASEPANERWVRHLAVFLAERGRLQEGAAVLSEALNHVQEKDEIERMRDRMTAEAAES